MGEIFDSLLSSTRHLTTRPFLHIRRKSNLIGFRKFKVALVYIVDMPGNGKEMITLALDVGGTGVKGCLLNEAGRPITPRERLETPNPATPDAVIEVLDNLAKN